MPTIRIIEKTEIWLSRVADGLDGIERETNFVIDHTKSVKTINDSIIVSSRDHLDFTNILTFNESVRIIITGQYRPKASYSRQTRSLNPLEFEGKRAYSDGKQVGQYAETYFTLNGKEPIRTKSYLYIYLDRDSHATTADALRNPSAGYGLKSEFSDNINNLGFLLDNGPTGSDMITLKAKTYYQEQVSKTAVAYFKISRSVSGVNVGVISSDI